MLVHREHSPPASQRNEGGRPLNLPSRISSVPSVPGGAVVASSSIPVSIGDVVSSVLVAATLLATNVSPIAMLLLLLMLLLPMLYEASTVNIRLNLPLKDAISGN